MRRSIWAALILLVAATPRAARADEWTKKFALTGKPELRVDTGDGNVKIRTGSEKEIEARVLTVGWRISPEEVRVVDRQAGDHVELEVRIPRAHWSGGHRSVRVDLTVPPEGNFEIHTSDGDISLEGVKGESRLSTGDGNVEARSLDGAFEAATGDGNLRVSGRFDRLSLKTGDGNIEAEVNPGSKMLGNWSARTGDGDLVLRLPEDFAADLDAHTGDGNIDLGGFPVTVSGSLRNSEVRGKLNGGGPTLLVRTGDGSIHLKRL